MSWAFDNGRPIYAQLVEKLQARIIAGIYKPGDRIPSVRELASEAAVNPNTMQKALMELERSGMIITQRTSGRVVTEDETLIDSMKDDMAKAQIHLFFDSMKELGFRDDEIKAQVEAALRGGEI